MNLRRFSRYLLLVLVCAAGIVAALAVVDSAWATPGDFYAKGTKWCATTYTGHPTLGGFGEAVDINFEPDYRRPVYAPENGKVAVHSKDSGKKSGWGNSIIWTSADGRESIHVAHLDEVVKTGQVSGGDLIAYAGATGGVEESKFDHGGAHLHVARKLDGRPAQLELSGRLITAGPSYGCADSYVSAGQVPPNPLSKYAGNIVQWDGDRKAQRTSWLVVLVDGKLRRRHIRDTATYYCLKANGAPEPPPLAAQVLDQLADQKGVRATCEFREDIAYYVAGGVARWRLTGSGPYTKHRFASPLALHCHLGYTVKEAEVPAWLISSARSGASLECPDGTFVRVVQTQQVFLVENGILRHIPNPAVLACIAGRADPFIVNIPSGINTPQGKPVSCSLDGRILIGPGGAQLWIKDGKRYPIQNPLISRCIEVRANTGPPITAAAAAINAYPSAGRNAWCPYPDGMLVRGKGQTQVWKVYANGTRHWVTCVPPGTEVAEVPAGEPDGHENLGQISLCNFEGKILIAPGGNQFWIKDGKRYLIQNTLISKCIEVRAGTGAPISATAEMVNQYPDAGRNAWCPYPDGMLVRGQGQTQVWKVYADGTRHWVTCVPSGTAVSEVPAGEPDGHRDIGQISLCNFEGKILLAPGGNQYWIKGGQRLPIQSTIISACIQGRTGSGPPMSEAADVINSYPQGRTAWCPYPDGALVRGEGQTQVWKVYANGTRHWVTCLPPGTPVSVVPAGEPDGHEYLGQISLC